MSPGIVPPAARLGPERGAAIATYAVGDVQGCDRTLERLLARLPLDPGRDRLWFVGDLVNRGPRSLAVLRRVHALGERAVVVLGNHDLYLLARAAGAARRRRDTLDEVLAAPDRDRLLAWLRARPLLHRDGGFVMVHAGLRAEWTVEEAARRARAVEAAVRGALLVDVVAGRAGALSDDLAVLTRIRMVSPGGRLEDYSGDLAGAPPGATPWFALPGRSHRDATIVFGHWAALGLHVADDVIGLDTGCVWGGTLTAVRLEDRAVISEPMAD
jgi:bis(5'-nucleosyl)-tetraphosphatase (symmetrical)